MGEKALNAHEETEFSSRIIEEAHEKDIEILIEIKYLGMIGVKEGYPGIEFLTKQNGDYTHKPAQDACEYERNAIEAMHICCDSKPAINTYETKSGYPQALNKP